MHVLSLEEWIYTFIYVIIQIKLFKPTINMYITHTIDHGAITINCYNKAKIQVLISLEFIYNLYVYIFVIVHTTIVNWTRITILSLNHH